MRDTRKARHALVVGVTAAIGAILLDQYLKPGLEKRLRLK